MSTPTPLACDLTAIGEENREQHRATSNDVFESVLAARELSSGYAFRLPTDTETIQKAGAFIARERLCCPFFRFRLVVRSEKSPVWLEISGRDGVKAFIEDTVLPYWDLEADEEADPSKHSEADRE